VVSPNEIGRPKDRPKPKRHASGVLTVSTAAEVGAAAEAAAAEVPAAEAAAAEAAKVPAAELAAAEAARVVEASAGEMSPTPMETEAVVVEAVVVEAVVEAVPSDEEARTPPVVIAVIRIRVSVTIVVARAIIRPVGVIATVRIVRIAGGGASDHSGRDARAGIVAVVGVAVSVSPNVVAMACVATRDIPVQAVRDPRVSRLPVMVSDGRRICGRNRRR
jgi:hypothetical protein